MKSKLAIGVAIILGLISFVGLYQVEKEREKKVEKKFEQISVWATARPLEKGAEINKSKLEPMAVLAQYAQGMVRSTNENLQMLRGLLLNRSVPRNRPLMWSDFSSRDQISQTRLGVNERAITIEVDSVSGLANLLTPNARADVLCTVTERGKDKEKSERTFVLLPNVYIYAIDDQTVIQDTSDNRGRRSRQGYSTVTFSVTPLEASVITFARTQGRLTLSLRNNKDNRVYSIPEVSSKNFEALVKQVKTDRLKGGVK